MNIKWVNLIPYPKDKYQHGDHLVYLIYAPSSRVYKIGWTIDIKQRIKELPRSVDQGRWVRPPYRLIHVIYTNSGRYLERQLHLLFAHRVNDHEWFYLTRHDVEWIINLGDLLPDGIPVNTDIVPPLADEDRTWD